jgi:rod shape-determining protein MreC
MAMSSLRRAAALVWALGNLTDQLAENRRMAEEINRLRIDIERLRRLERQNAELRGMLRFAQRSPHRLIACEVIGRGDVTGWWQTIRLNKGEADGVTTNLAVITADGVVGRTEVTSAHTADVLLIADPKCKISAVLSRTGGFGIVRGGGAALTGAPALEMLCSPGLCRMDYIAREATLMAGDEVLTSGLGGVFPKDLLVGRVVRAHRDESGLYQRAEVAPTAELGNLTTVFVVLRR